MKRILKLSTILAVVISFTSCGDKTKRTPNLQFMPNMYESVGYETYGENKVFSNDMATRLPAKGSVARGEVPYDYPDTNEGYEEAKLNLKSPYKPTKKNLENGKKMYAIYCAICHGKGGDGQGQLVKNEKFLGIPNYKDRDITEGSIYQVIMYGRNLMGSHASQLTEKERWQVTMYVQQLRNDLIK